MLTVLALVVVAGGAAFAVSREGESQARCAEGAEGPGSAGEAERRREARQRVRGESRAPENDLFTGPPAVEPRCGELPGQPESFADLARANAGIVAKSVAPGDRIRAGAYRAAIGQRADMPTVGGPWSPYGTPPLQSYRTDYDQTDGSTRAGLGDLSGRATAVARIDGALYAAISNGGIWKSTDGGDSWTSIGENLPTQVVAGIAGSADNLLVLTGDNAFGGNTYAGLGAYRSTDGGRTWTHASGIPDGLLAFRLAVDPNDPAKVYAATGGGLFRSTDGGASYTNVALPTGDCAGKPTSAKDCFLANVVTDVVVQAPANAATPGGKPGAVLAAVGWRAGTKPNANGVPQSPGNGIYVSDDGAPGTFRNMDLAANAQSTTDPLTQDRIGRIALGAATGPDQDHRIVYAIVQDAVKFNGGVVGLDANENGTTSAAQSDVFNAVYVSTDFGRSFKELEGSSTMDSDTSSDSALSPPVCKTPAIISYCPGVQAWYNLWVAPDPTRQTAAGVPTRLGFGLEEVWSNTGPLQSPTGLDGSTPVKFDVVGRYYAGETCTLLNATNGLPVCPAAENGQVPKFTTHPDQHGGLWVPDATGGGVTLLAANDGGVYKQHVAAGEDLSNNNWGQGKPEGRSGSNQGLNTLQPYDAAMAKDGTVYMGLQDNGEAKIEPDGTMYTIFGGDGFFSAVDPDNAQVAYEEYVGGDIRVTKDGGKNWTDIAPPLTAAQFSTPFEMDRNDANHLVIGGRNIFETTAGPGTTSNGWKEVFDLGKNGRANNQTSAIDTLSLSAGAGAATGPKTADMSYTGGSATVPGPGNDITGVFVPGTYDDRPFTVGENDGDAAVRVDVTWQDDTYDWDLYLLDKDGTVVASSATATPGKESIVYPNPKPGAYTVRVANYAAAGTFDAKVTFDQRTSDSTTTSATYIGFCGYCDTITQGTPFNNGLATNVGDRWHVARAAGLPSRYITSVRMDPSEPRTVFVTLAGYGRRWAFPGAVGEDTSKVGVGHVFKSTDAGETFTDITGDLPDTPANWTALWRGRLVVGTDIGVFISSDASGGDYARLGTNLPTTPVSTLRFKPGNPDLLVVATYGRGVYTFDFAAKGNESIKPVAAGAPTACAASAGFTSVRVTPRKRGLRFRVKRAVAARYGVEVVQQSRGRRVLQKRVVKRFRNRKRSFTWKGAGTRGVYFVRVHIRKGRVFDVRRFAFARSRGRFKRRPQFFARESCSVLRSAKLNGPTFGGRFKRPLAVAFRLRAAGAVTVTYAQRGRTLLRRTVEVKDVRYHRVRLRSAKARRGDVRVTLSASAGGAKRTVRLVGRRL